MKKYKNLSQAVLLYIASIALFFIVVKPLLYNYPYITLISTFLALYGILLGIKSIKEKEIPIIGYFVVLVGALIVLASIGILQLELSPI